MRGFLVYSSGLRTTTASSASAAATSVPARLSSGSRSGVRQRFSNCPQPHSNDHPIALPRASTTEMSTAQVQAPTSTQQPLHSSQRTQPQYGVPAQLPLDSQPVMMCRTYTLAPQVDVVAAAQALRQELVQVVERHKGCASGCLRLEVPVPRGLTALRWLMAQQQQLQQLQQSTAAPLFYFSGRHSSAPDTPLAARAEAATKGWFAVAGVGAAWRWQGPGGGGFDSLVVKQMQRFLASNQPRVRILGGTRFAPDQAPAPEWASWGAYLFALPLIEYLEVEGGALLAVTLAWDSTYGAPASTGHTSGGAGHTSLHAPVTPVHGVGAASLQQAAAAAEQRLVGLAAPSPYPSAPALRVTAEGAPTHVPDQQEWQRVMSDLLTELEKQQRQEQGGSSGGGLDQGRPHVPWEALDVGLAKQEFLMHGQQGLDGLLAALEGASRVQGAAAAGKGSDGEEPSSDSDMSPGAGGGEEEAARPLDPDAGTQAALSKVVLARRSTFQYSGALDGLWLLEALQERDPRAYQLYMADGSGRCFLGCTPERLYARTGPFVASEAVAGTRPRGPPGDVERDFWLSLDLLRSEKDDREFRLVRDWIRDALASCAERIEVEVPKSVIKQRNLQHLYGRLAAELRPGVNDAQILKALHPTPAVCGRPREAAFQWLSQQESFDRGYYAGPFGWISGAGAEWAVAIRSALIEPGQPGQTISNGNGTTSHDAGAALVNGRGPRQQQQQAVLPPQYAVNVYAGVGIVPGSVAASEWDELELKTRPIRSLLQPFPALMSAPNINIAWAGLLVEELCRQGVNMFCVAPGSRSSPLAAAVAAHPRARLNVCIDERSLGFWALGFGRASGRPAATITSSGTAVANLLPAVVEASLSEVPMLLLTADRPPELRDTGANQTIDQVKIFGSFTRWFSDVPPPTPGVPGRALLTTAATALRFSMGAGGSSSCGPVHLNLQFREPLAPASVPWQPQQLLSGLERWLAPPYRPFTTNVAQLGSPGVEGGSGGGMYIAAGVTQGFPAAGNSHGVAGYGNGHSTTNGNGFSSNGSSYDTGLTTSTSGNSWSTLGQQPLNSWDSIGASLDSAPLEQVLSVLRNAKRGLIVLGELPAPEDGMAAAAVATALGWPVVADVLSGLRLHRGTAGSSSGTSNAGQFRGTSSGVAQPQASASASALQGAGLSIIHSMDHILLGDASWWAQLRPDVILQLGPRLTSKRVTQFLEWSVSDTSSGAEPAQWVYVGRSGARHDAAHLVSWRVCASPAQFASTLAAHAASWQQQQQQHYQGHLTSSTQHYKDMLQALDAAVSHEIDVAISMLPRMSEPAVARQLAAQLPHGHALFLGNSMPIRDMDMYAHPAPSAITPALAKPELACSTSVVPESDGAATDPAAEHGHSNGEEGSSYDWWLGVQQQLPRGGALSGTGSASSHSTGSRGSGALTLLGVPTSANRGASGIDGVLSTAAGYAEGLSRPVTLVVGDLSFLHDVNGLNLLRAGESRPPLTVVLINNAGGGIFSFLPIAAAVPEDVFTPLWATPQAVDLEGMCRAHGLPHQRVTRPEQLPAALASAWGLNRHSIIEVTTQRGANVEDHRVIQKAAMQAARTAYRLLQAAGHPGTVVDMVAGQTQGVMGVTSSQAQATAAAASTSTPQSTFHQVLYPPPAVAPAPAQYEISHFSWAPFSLPLTRPLTTSAGHASRERQGAVVRIHLRAPGSAAGFVEGVGEVAPLPGLHQESLQQAEAQLGLLQQLLCPGGSGGGVSSSAGLSVPATLALSKGRVLSWLRDVVGVDVEHLYPSVRSGLECALLSALSAAAGSSSLLGLVQQQGVDSIKAGAAQQAGSSANSVPSTSGQQQQQQQGVTVQVAGLVATQSVEQAVQSARDLVAAGHTALKIKVARRGSTPAQDAQLVLAVREAVGPQVTLRADANRGWTFDDALAFAAAVQPACLEFVEEPCEDPEHLPAWAQQSGMAYALDETVDEMLAGRGVWRSVLDLLTSHSLSSSSSSGASLDSASYSMIGSSGGAGLPGSGSPATGGLAALVLKPSLLGGPEASLLVAQQCIAHGARVIISACFESAVGMAGLAEVAAAVDNMAVAAGMQPAAHGLGTLPWLVETVPGVAGASCQPPTRLLSQSQQQHAFDVVAASADIRRWAASQPQPGAGQQQAGSKSGGAQVTGSNSEAQCTWRQQSISASVATASGVVQVAVHAEVVTPAAISITHRCQSDSHQPDENNTAASSAKSASKARPHQTLVFLHGFLGSAQDWQPLMQAAAAAGHACIALDLPGHGGTSCGSSEGLSVEQTADLVADALRQHLSQQQQQHQNDHHHQQGQQEPQVVLVGYSMGARVALSLALRHPDLISRLALISATPGIKSPSQAASRVAADHRLAAQLRAQGLPAFLEAWYSGPLWSTLRAHPQFGQLVQARAQSGDAEQLATSLEAMSTGRMAHMWAQIPQLPMPVLLLAGQQDSKFVTINAHMVKVARGRANLKLVVVPETGHAVHTERPLAVLQQLLEFCNTSACEP